MCIMVHERSLMCQARAGWQCHRYVDMANELGSNMAHELDGDTNELGGNTQARGDTTHKFSNDLGFTIGGAWKVAIGDLETKNCVRKPVELQKKNPHVNPQTLTHRCGFLVGGKISTYTCTPSNPYHLPMQVTWSVIFSILNCFKTFESRISRQKRHFKAF